MAVNSSYMTSCICAYAFAIVFLILVAWAVNVLTMASKPVNEETCNKYCGSQVTQGVLYIVGAILALAAMIACAVTAAAKSKSRGGAALITDVVEA